MRKIIACMAFLGLVFPGGAMGQGFSFGAVAGFNLSNLDFQYTQPGFPGMDTRTGLRFGGFVERHVYGPVFAQLGIDYNERGYSVEVATTDYTGTDTGKKTLRPYIRYLSFPLLLKARPEIGQFDPFVMLGPRFDVRVGESDDFGDLGDGFGDTQWGLTLGGGAEIALMPRLSLVVAVLYNSDFEEAYQTDLLKIERSSFDFIAGVRF